MKLINLLQLNQDQYLALPIEEEIDSLLWWQAHYSEFPVLSDIARDYLSIQVTSIAAEHAFSVAGNTISKLGIT
jgi:hypothetical protein